MKKFLSIFIAAILMILCMTEVLAADGNLKSTDTSVLTDTLTSMSDAEKAEFVNENLDVKMQHLSTLATLSADMLYGEIADEVKAALDDGLMAVEIKEAIYHSAAYCGYTRAAGALDAADEALKSLGKDIPYSSRITSTEENRYNDGLNVQRELFGPQIGTVTDGMSEAMKLQTLYLSGICFGDFYNRTGLSLYTREFLTFCTIAANGSCGGQLMGHANGNLNVGHSADMLRAAVLLNEKSNGAEKTALALSVINTVAGGETKNAPTEPAGKTETITTSYKSDSEELLGITAHFDADDKDGFIDKNLDAKTQEIILNTVNAVIEGTAVPTSDDAKAKALIDLTVIAAQGGREDEVPANYAANIAAGNTGDTMLAAALLCTPYNGFPRTLNIMSAINSAVNTAPTAPVQSDKTTVTMRINDPVMTINGAEKNIDENGTVPVIIDDRTLLPVRAFVEGIGGTVEWDESARTATLAYNGDVIKLTIDSTTAYLNDAAQTLDVTPVIINDRTMLPIRFIAESFKFTVDWDGDTQTITITKYIEAIVSDEPVIEPTATSEPVTDNDTLIVYFSRTGEQYGVGTIDKGNTAVVADMIAEETGADTFEILPKEDNYPKTYDALTDVAKTEQNENARPEIASGIENFNDYNTIFIGYPIWWGDMPMIVYTFLESYSFDGKTVIPFCTHAGSALAGTESTIKNKLSGANVLDGLAISGTTAQNDRDSARELVKNWLDGLELNK